MEELNPSTMHTKYSSDMVNTQIKIWKVSIYTLANDVNLKNVDKV